MRMAVRHFALVCIVGLVLAGQAQAQYARRTAIVEAVARTKDGIVTLKVTRTSEWGKRNVVGTGVIVDERGFMITNHHVVDGADKIMATLSDKTTVEARVHTELPKFDLAILRLSGKKKVKALSFAPGSDLMQGETIIAVGNPYGYANSVSPGIISALGREITMPSGETLTNLIQHTANINPGNSGGPLLNINGELIGINVALREGAQGISFALNADTVKDALSRHLSASKISKVAHGLKCEENVGEDSKARQKVVVSSVTTPAARAALKKGDVIVKMGSVSVHNRFDVERALWGYKAGDKVETAVLRDGKLTSVSLTLSETESRVTAASGTSRGR